MDIVIFNPCIARPVYIRFQASFKPDKMTLNPFRPKFSLIIFIHYKPKIAVTILDL